MHSLFLFFFFNDTATTEIYTLSLHDALPISARLAIPHARGGARGGADANRARFPRYPAPEFSRRFDEVFRSEEHTSELQSHLNLVCRLLLEKKKKKNR